MVGSNIAIPLTYIYTSVDMFSAPTHCCCVPRACGSDGSNSSSSDDDKKNKKKKKAKKKKKGDDDDEGGGFSLTLNVSGSSSSDADPDNGDVNITFNEAEEQSERRMLCFCCREFHHAVYFVYAKVLQSCLSLRSLVSAPCLRASNGAWKIPCWQHAHCLDGRI